MHREVVSPVLFLFTHTETMKAIKLLVVCVVATCITTSCYPTKMRANYGNQCTTFRR
jgi:hypothetical protein